MSWWLIMFYPEFNDLLQRLKYSDVNKRRFVLKEIAASIDHATKEDLHDLLDFLHTTHDKELQVKIFSILSMYLLCNNTNIHIFVSFHPLYETIDSILSKNLPQKTTVVLNFLTLLLQSNYIENAFMKSSLYTHVQNRIRTSGCLATMTDIFLGSMVYQDTWRALCRCLAETCNNSEHNQNYCTHLIPKCVKRCAQRNMGTFPVLQSLVQNNKRNVELFLECDGMYLFNRKLLQYECSLQLLSTIVQTSAQAAIFAQKQGITKYVHELLRLCGPYTKTGQWATVIIYYADLQMKGYEKELKESFKTTNKTQTTGTNVNIPVTDDGDDTLMLRNAIKEIVLWHTKEQDMCKNIFITNKDTPNRLKGDNFCMDAKQFDREMLHFTRDSYHKKVPTKVRNHISVQKPSHVNELSFSFLSNHFNVTNKYECNRNTLKNCHETIENNNQTHTYDTITTETESHVDINKFYNEHKNENTLWNLKEFKPNFVSTPKHRNRSLNGKINKRTRNITIESRTGEKVNITPRMSAHKKTLTQRSFKARIFDAINNSCTALVNSVASIFKPKNVASNSADFNANSKDDKKACSYSFTEYMRKRDADALNEMKIENVEQNLSTEPDTCKTCNSTTVMKNKMLHNEFLKATVKKLKVGINLYGCDFKKISKIMWPDEDYMTPAILYNLYRKVIMK